MKPKDTLAAFEAHLLRAKRDFEAVVIGGAALVLLDVVRRGTRDVDVLSPEIPAEVQELARLTAVGLRDQGVTIGDDWLNNGPQSLQDTLPEGWRDRLVRLHNGPALHLWTLSRADLLKTKLFAYCDRGSDRLDCLALRPTAAELHEALPWVAEQDANAEWPAHVRERLGALGEELEHGL